MTKDEATAMLPELAKKYKIGCRVVLCRDFADAPPVSGSFEVCGKPYVYRAGEGPGDYWPNIPAMTGNGVRGVYSGHIADIVMGPPTTMDDTRNYLEMITYGSI